MHRTLRACGGVALLASLSLVAIGCLSGSKSFEAAARAPSRASAERKLVRSGDLVVSVASPEEASRESERLVVEAGGLVERSTAVTDSHVQLHCRVPAPHLDHVMDAVAALGDEDRRSVSTTDVTDEHADLETRLRNDIALRDRLQALLEQASDVEDVLAIERELNRLQSDIESMQARFDRLESRIEMSELSIRLERKRVLGPLGYVGYGIWWALSKLFVIE